MKFSQVLKKFKRTAVIASLMAICLHNVDAQQYSPSIKWKKIDTEHFEVVFQDNIEKEGQRVANLMEYVYKPVGSSLNTEPKKLTLVLNTTSSMTNGYVRIAPIMSQWYNVPPLDVSVFGSSDWYTLLAIHEYRHVVQTYKIDNGFTHIGRIFFGDYGMGALSQWTVPGWYKEGDAVCTETALSGSGRGRVPRFQMYTKARLLEGDKYAFSKPFLGSYKDYVEGEYVMGYQMTSYTREKYGFNIWDELLDNVSNESYNRSALSKYLKKNTRVKLPAMYSEVCDSLKAGWEKQIDTLEITDVEPVNVEGHKFFTSFMYPQITPDGDVIALMNGLDDPQTLVKISDDGHEEKLAQINSYSKISYANGLVAWESTRSHVRWGNTSWSEIMVYDIEKKAKKRITLKTRYFSPALSPDGQKVAVVEHSIENKSQILILSTATGKILEALPNEQSSVLHQPSWSEDGRKLVYTSGLNNKLALKIYDFESKSEKTIMDYMPEVISAPVFIGSKVLFNSPITGVGAIHAIDTTTGKRTLVCQRKFGAYNAMRGNTGSEVYFQDFSSKGYKISKFNLDQSSRTEMDNFAPVRFHTAEALAKQEGGQLDFEKIPQKQYEVKKYSQLQNLIKVHSWGVLPLGTEYRAFVASTNKLNTLDARVGYAYNVNEKNSSVYANAVYSKYFPQLSITSSYGARKINTDSGDTVKWDENNILAGIILPLNFSRNIFTTQLNINNFYGYNKAQNFKVSDVEVPGEFDINYLTHSVNFTSYKRPAPRDLGPRLGIASLLSYSHTLHNTDLKGSLLTGTLELWLPSVFKNHSILLQGAYEKQEEAEYAFASNVVFVRGYKWERNNTFQKIGVNYAFPIACPDWDILRFFYLKRLSANLFYDYGWGKTVNNHDVSYESVGTELKFNFHLFDLPYEISIGPRFSYKANGKPMIEIALFGIGS